MRTVLRVADAYHRAHPRAPKVLVGDLSRPHGGPFGRQFGGLGHLSHQNGLDVDVYYPRKDRELRAPTSPRQIDRRLAQDLVDRFVAAGARIVFVGPSTGLTGPRQIVRPLVHHDNHMHVRIAAQRSDPVVGRSVQGRPIVAYERGDRSVPATLVVGVIHGDETAGLKVVAQLRRMPLPRHVHLWLVPAINPDGLAAGTRENARGVDLNRNWPASWRREGRPWSGTYSGPRPLSEPENRAMRRLLLRVRPRLTIWYHQPLGLVCGSDPHVRVLKRYARLTGLPYVRRRVPHGAATLWERIHLRGVHFVVEFPPGRISTVTARRHARAVLALAP